MTGSGDEIAAAAGGRGRLRASHADREQVIGTLKTAFAEGRLDKDELEALAGQALTSRTYAELAALTADIPAGPAAAPPPCKPARAQAGPSVRTSIKMGAGAIAVAAMLEALSLGATWPQIAVAIVAALVFGVIVAGVVALPIAGVLKLESRHRNRSGGQLPPPSRSAPGAGGQALGDPASAASAGQFPQVDHGQQHPAEAAQNDLPGPASSGSRPLDGWRPRGRRYAIG
jgi:hypothetical protein